MSDRALQRVLICLMLSGFAVVVLIQLYLFIIHHR